MTETQDRLVALQTKARLRLLQRKAKGKAGGLSARSIPMAAEAAAEGGIDLLGFLSGASGPPLGVPLGAALAPFVSPEQDTMSLKEAATSAGILGNYPPQNRSEEILAAGARAALPAALTGIGGGPVAMAALAGGAGLGGAGAEAVSPNDPVAQLVGQTVGTLGVGGATNLATKSIKAATGRGGNDVLTAMRAEGVTPRLPGDATRSVVLQRGQAALASTTGARSVFDAIENTNRDVGLAVERAAKELGPATSAEQAGRALQAGTERFVDAMRAKGAGLYGRLGEWVKPDDIVPLSKTQLALKKIADQFPSNPELGAVLQPSTFGRIGDALATSGGNLSWQELRALRSYVGDKLTESVLVSDVPRKQWASLYGALSDDMRSVAAAKGPEALRAFDRADKFWSFGMTQVEDRLQPLVKSGIPEKIYQAAIGNVGTELKNLRRLVGRKAWGDVAGFTLRRLGMARPGAQGAAGDDFSMGTFLTEWNKLTPQSKLALFSGSEYGATVTHLNRVAKIAEGAKRGSSVMNTSQTAGTGYFIGMLSGTGGFAAGGLEGAAAAVVAPWAVAKLVTNPRFVRWLATPVGPDKVPAHLAALAPIVNEAPDMEPYIREFLRAAQGNQ